MDCCCLILAPNSIARLLRRQHFDQPIGACCIGSSNLQSLSQTLARLCICMLQEFVRVNGPTDESLRLPNTLSISIQGLAAPSLLQQLKDKLAASAGAACHSKEGPAVSPVLQAMKVWCVVVFCSMHHVGHICMVHLPVCMQSSLPCGPAGCVWCINDWRISIS